MLRPNLPGSPRRIDTGPTPGGGEEPVAGHVGGVKIDREPRALLIVDLRVEEEPALLPLCQYSQTQWSSNRSVPK